MYVKIKNLTHGSSFLYVYLQYRANYFKICTKSGPKLFCTHLKNLVESCKGHVLYHQDLFLEQYRQLQALQVAYLNKMLFQCNPAKRK